MSLEGRVALVTGSTGRGMGRSIALSLARDGADVALNYETRPERAQQMRAQLQSMGRRASLHQADVATEEGARSLFEGAIEELGRVDILVLSAGGAWQARDIVDTPPQHWQRVLAEELHAPLYLNLLPCPGCATVAGAGLSSSAATMRTTFVRSGLSITRSARRHAPLADSDPGPLGAQARNYRERDRAGRYPLCRARRRRFRPRARRSLAISPRPAASRRGRGRILPLLGRGPLRHGHNHQHCPATAHWSGLRRQEQSPQLSRARRQP